MWAIISELLLNLVIAIVSEELEVQVVQLRQHRPPAVSGPGGNGCLRISW